MTFTYIFMVQLAIVLVVKYKFLSCPPGQFGSPEVIQRCVFCKLLSEMYLFMWHIVA